MKSNDFLVSIVLPVYNAERFVADAIESVLGQSYKKIELIIINDGSTDSSDEICRRYMSDSRVRYYHRENKGLSASRQFGIDLCTGDFFATLDADDFFSSSFVERMLKCITEACGDISVCSWINFCDEKILNVRSLCVPSCFLNVDHQKLVDEYRKIGSSLTLSDSWNKLYRTSFVRESGVRFDLPKKYNGNDLAFNYKLLLHCPKYCVIKESLVSHRIVSGSMVHKKKKLLQDGFNCITDQIINEMNALGMYMPRQISLFYYHLLCLAFWDSVEYSCGAMDLFAEISECMRKHLDYIKKNSIEPVNDYTDFPFFSKCAVKCLQRGKKEYLFALSLLVKFKRLVLGEKKWA